MQKLTKILCLAALAGASVSAVQAAPASPQGFISGRAWTGIGGVAVANLTADPRFPDSPTNEQYPPYFEWNPQPAGAPDIITPAANWADNYGGQLIGYFYPPTTGEYRFWLAADDGAALYLSTDDTAANKKLIATETGWSGIRSFTAVGGGSTVQEKDSATFAGSEWPTPNVITLTAGQAYYIEALWKEGGGGDNCAVAVEDPTGQIDPTLPIPGEYLATIDKTMGAVNITTQPASQTIVEGTPVTFSVVVNGTPPYTYQWKREGVDIAGATGKAYTIAAVSAADAGVFTVAVTGGQGAVTSAGAVLTVDADTEAPTLVRAVGNGSPTSVKVTFSEPVDPTTAQTASNYQISGGVSVTAATLSGANAVVLTTSAQADNQVYTLTVSGVKDTSLGGNVIAAGSTINFNSVTFIKGIVQWERWPSQNNDINNFLTQYEAGSLGSPAVTWVTPLFESGRDFADNYWAHGWTWLTPASNGEYRFIITVDDNARVFLSEDADPANRLTIAAESSWSNNRDWNGASEEQDTETWATDLGGNWGSPQWPTFEIGLNAGTKYYLEVFYQEGGGGDGAELTWTAFGDPKPANGTASALTGDLIGAYADPTTLAPIIKSPTGNMGMTVDGGSALNLSVVIDGAISYQWYKNGKMIAGATSANFSVAESIATDSGQYYATGTNPQGTVQSPLMNVMVTATGVFAIEAEDFDNNGVAEASASVMPYTGDAYNGLGATFDVDYHSTQAGSESIVYRAGDVATNGSHMPMAQENAGAQFSMQRMGEWVMTTNYKSGWIDGGDWGNYTRDFPAGNYWVFAGASNADGNQAGNALRGSLGVVTAGKGTTSQTVNILATYSAPGTAGWSRNNLVAMSDGSGNPAVLSLSGSNTIRWNYDSGDVDYLVFVPASVSEEVAITGVTREGNSITVTWTGGGEAEVSDSLNGPWQATGNTTGTLTTTIDTANGAAFMRVRK